MYIGTGGRASHAGHAEKPNSFTNLFIAGIHGRTPEHSLHPVKAHVIQQRPIKPQRMLAGIRYVPISR